MEVHYSKLIPTICRVWRLKVVAKRSPNPATAAAIINPPYCDGTVQKAQSLRAHNCGLMRRTSYCGTFLCAQ